MLLPKYDRVITVSPKPSTKIYPRLSEKQTEVIREEESGSSQIRQNITMYSYLWFLIAALGEIAGCYTFWMWLRESKSPLWLLPGFLSLALFAFALTRIDSAIAGRAFAAYGGIYILSSLIWMATVERTKPDLWDIIGTLLCLLGSAFILLPHRA